MFEFEKLTNVQLRFLAETVMCPFVEDDGNDCDCCFWTNGNGCIPHEVCRGAVEELINRGKL